MEGYNRFIEIVENVWNTTSLVRCIMNDVTANDVADILFGKKDISAATKELIHLTERRVAL